MKALIDGIGFLFFIILVTSCSPAKKYSTSNGHSHNDYLSANPFFGAFNAGFGSIEADIFPVDGDLFVAHHRHEIQQKYRLNGLYFQPLLESFSKGESRQLNLLIDIKDNYKASLELLISQLEPIKQFLSTPTEKKKIIISISGSRPLPSEYHLYPHFIFFDDDLKNKHTPDQWKRVSLVSLPFNKISTWKGQGEINRDDENKIRRKIDSVHSAGKPIRFWAAPDTEASWKLQMKLKADFIGTDKINELSAFLNNSGNKKSR